MTLLELTMGLVVTGLIISAGYMSFSTVIDRREAAARTMSATARAVGLRQTLTQWMRNGTVQFPSVTSANPEVALKLISRTPMRTPQAGVRLFVNQNSSHSADAFSAPMGPGLIAVFTPDAGNDSMFVMLDSTITDMRIEYFAIQNKARAGWFSLEDPQAQSGAMALRVRLASNDPDLNAALARPIEVPLKGVR